MGATLVAISAVGIALMFGTGQAYIQAEGDNRVAIQLAQQRLEQVRGSGFGATSGTDPREEASWTNIASHTGYQRTTTITSVCPTDFTLAVPNPASPPGGCVPAPTTGGIEAKQITVTVRAIDTVAGTVDAKTTPVTLQSVMVLQ